MSTKWIGRLVLTLLCWGNGNANPIQTLNLQSIREGVFKVRVTDNRATVVVFVSVICPMSVDYFSRVESIRDEYSGRGALVLLVDSNSNDSDSDIDRYMRESGLRLPIHRDPEGAAANMLRAFATPTAVVLDSGGEIRYWGTVDDSRLPDKVRRQHDPMF